MLNLRQPLLGALLLEDDRSSIPHQNFPPLGTTCSSSSIQQSSSHNSSSSSSVDGSTKALSPLQTRAQRLKKGTKITPLHKQRNMIDNAATTSALLMRDVHSAPDVSHVREGWKLTIHPHYPHEIKAGKAATETGANSNCNG
ncbi:hypothetical protein LguiA_033589 [Lonicera macranthoides]